MALVILNGCAVCDLDVVRGLDKGKTTRKPSKNINPNGGRSQEIEELANASNGTGTGGANKKPITVNGTITLTYEWKSGSHFTNCYPETKKAGLV